MSDDSDSEDDAFADVKSWGPDLMGDAKDRNKYLLFSKYSLASLTELERETILADRRKRIELLHEHQELKARIGQQLGRRMNTFSNLRIWQNKGIWKGKRACKVEGTKGK